MFQDATDVTDDVATDDRIAAGNNLCGWALPWSALWQVVKLSSLPVDLSLYIFKCLGEKTTIMIGILPSISQAGCYRNCST